MTELYDAIGKTYAEYRRPDARIAAAITVALADARAIVNIGAGTGSYEPNIAIVVLGRWRPLGVAAASLLFGAAYTLQNLFQSLGFENVPYNLFLATTVRAHTHRSVILPQRHVLACRIGTNGDCVALRISVNTYVAHSLFTSVTYAVHQIA